MSLIDVFLKRRGKSSAGFRPQVEMLEQRECPSVAAPTNLQATALSSTQVKLTWNDVATEAGYRVYRWTGTQSVLVAQVARNITTYQINALPPNTTQWFRVESFDLSTKALSTWASVVTPPEAITAPTNVKLSGATLNSMTVTWSFVNSATGYRIFTWDGAKAVQIGSVGKTVNAFNVQNLTPGTNYYFYVQAFNATNAASSAWVSGSTLASGITAPTNVKALVVNSTSISISWNDVASESGYRLYRNVNGQAVLVTTLAANTTSFQVTGLLPGQTYSFFVQSFTPTSSANSAWVDATTSGAALQSVTNLTATPTGPSTVRLNWTGAAGAAGYRVWVWSGSYWVPWTIVSSTTTQFTVGGLFSNRTHWFMIEAFTTNFTQSAFSTRVSAFL